MKTTHDCFDRIKVLVRYKITTVKIMSDEFEQAAESGASETYPKQCSQLRKNEFVMLKSKPCKIVDMSTSKTGKHGHAKVHMVGIEIFDQKKYEDICPSTHNMNVPHVKRSEYTLISINDDGFLSLMDENAEVREDLKVEGDLLKDIEVANDGNGDVMVTVLKAVGIEKVMSCKLVKSA